MVITSKEGWNGLLKMNKTWKCQCGMSWSKWDTECSRCGDVNVNKSEGVKNG